MATRPLIRFSAGILSLASTVLQAQTNPPADVVISGEESDNFGWSVSAVGDINDDGIDDLLVGAPASPAISGFAGRAFLFFGPLPASLTSTDADVIFNPAGAFGDNFGISVTNAGDVNNDGNDDILIGARSSDAGGIQSGRAYLYLGPFSPGIVQTSEAAALFTGDDFDELGWSLAPAGDVNNDGFGDILVGCPQALASLGRVLLFHGPLSGSYTPADADASVQGEISDERLGSSVAGIGDMNGDGFDDILIGQFSPLIPVRNSGRALLFYGPVAGELVAGDADAQIVGEVVDDRLGISVAGAGDVNGDGNADVLFGADQFWSEGRGMAYLFLGPLSGVLSAGEAQAILRGERNGDQFGTFVRSAGDVNGDQVPDILVGATNAGTALAGSAYLFHGPLQGRISAADAASIFSEMAGGGWFGNSAAAGGDLTGDARGDVAVGAPLSDFPSEDAGRVYLFSVGDQTATVPCEDISRVRAKCNTAGRVLIAVNLVRESGHDGKTLEFLVDSKVAVQATISNDRARVEVTTSPGASHVVELTDPPGCLDPIVATCAAGENITFLEGEEEETLPGTTSLLQNYPNPFNPETKIRFQLGDRGWVSVKVHDVLGREVAVVHEGYMDAGTHSVTWDAGGVPSGVYFCRFEFGNVRETRKLVVLK